jgi:hypothetical protein
MERWLSLMRAPPWPKMSARVAFRALEVAHVLDDAEHRRVTRRNMPMPETRVDQRRVLRGRPITAP